MAGGNRRKCKCCRTLFRPDPRNRHHQRYCSATACRAASKAASQARWRAAPKNQGYFRGPVNVARVQVWRSRHPGYWRRARRVGTALQDLSTAQPVDSFIGTATAAGSPLQEVFRRSFLRVRNVTRRTSELAQDLVWDYQIRPKDAIHVATSIEARVTILETFDEHLIRRSGSIGEPPITIRLPIGPDQGKLPL
jgi:hypothetical protein